MALLAIPGVVLWSYLVAGVVLALGLALTLPREEWSRALGLDKLIRLGPAFYAAPLAGFGTEHFTRADVIASIVPAFMPWPRFWTYFIGASFIATALSLVTGLRARLAASLLALTFFLFVVLMDVPGWRRTRGTGLRSRSRCGNWPSAAALWPWQQASRPARASTASLRRSHDTSSRFPCWSTASSNSCTALTCLAFP
jgi:hypothetical protein